jgi:hypothetical protein
LFGKLQKFVIDAGKCFGPPPGETVLQNGDSTANGVLYPVIPDLSFHTWPPRSPDLILYDFFLWRYVKDVVYVPPLPNDLQKLRQRIIAAVATINRDMLERVWTEMDYRIDVCRVIRGSHIVCLKGNISKL